jgi:L-asparaginase / beta-aspartyl-peptidase
MRTSCLLPLLTVSGLIPLLTTDRPAKLAEAKIVLVIHGGAGVLTDDEMKAVKLENGKMLKREDYEQALAEALDAGWKKLQQKGGKTNAVDAVEAAIRVMEDSELFNAGRGAALNEDGQAELDAALMEGKMDSKKGDPPGKLDPRKRAGAVAAVRHIKNPISAARAVMENPRQGQVLLVGEGAERFAFAEENRKRYPGQIVEVSNVYFWTGRRLGDIRKAFKPERDEKEKLKPREQAPGRSQCLGTVGAVARHEKTLAAGTSTGGLTNKARGRVGDTPLIGAGTYADDHACGVSCTGTGEVFIRHAVAHDVVARMLYGGHGVAKAARETIDQLPDEEGGVGGLIALDKDGNHAFAMSEKSVGMYRGYVTEEGEIFVAIFRVDEPEAMVRGKKGGWEKKKR